MNITFFVFCCVIGVLVILLLGLNTLLAVKKPDIQKDSIYESGFEPVTGQTRSQITINFLLVAILFLLFDLELALFYPFAVSLESTFVYCIGLIFFGILTAGLVYELSYGIINFDIDREKNKEDSSDHPYESNWNSINKKNPSLLSNISISNSIKGEKQEFGAVGSINHIAKGFRVYSTLALLGRRYYVTNLKPKFNISSEVKQVNTNPADHELNLTQIRLKKLIEKYRGGWTKIDRFISHLYTSPYSEMKIKASLHSLKQKIHKAIFNGLAYNRATKFLEKRSVWAKRDRIVVTLPYTHKVWKKYLNNIDLFLANNVPNRNNSMFSYKSPHFYGNVEHQNIKKTIPTLEWYLWRIIVNLDYLNYKKQVQDEHHLFQLILNKDIKNTHLVFIYYYLIPVLYGNEYIIPNLKRLLSTFQFSQTNAGYQLIKKMLVNKKKETQYLKKITGQATLYYGLNQLYFEIKPHEVPTLKHVINTKIDKQSDRVRRSIESMVPYKVGRVKK